MNFSCFFSDECTVDNCLYCDAAAATCSGCDAGYILADSACTSKHLLLVLLLTSNFLAKYRPGYTLFYYPLRAVFDPYRGIYGAGYILFLFPIAPYYG